MKNTLKLTTNYLGTYLNKSMIWCERRGNFYARIFRKVVCQMRFLSQTVLAHDFTKKLPSF